MALSERYEKIMQDSSWADGLRGLAAIYVAASHLVLCFGLHLTNPCCADDRTRTPWLFQRPIFRLIASGHSWVAVFLVLLGFVNALKPIKQARNGNWEAALAGLSTASLRRSFRLVLPAATATVISWILCQLGAYQMARNSDAFWLHNNSPVPSKSWAQAVWDLVHALFATWRLAEDNDYDQPQWALIYLLQGSIMLFFVLMATVQLSAVWRTSIIFLCVIWSWEWSHHLADPLTGYTVLGGVLFAEFSLTSTPLMLASIPGVATFVAPALAFAGLYLMSCPASNVDQAYWSNTLDYFFRNTFPLTAQVEVPRLIGSTGALMLCAGILISPQLRYALSTPVLRWLGKLSFPIYLLHGSIMRTLLAWLVFVGQPLIDVEVNGPTPDAPKAYQARYATPGSLRIFASIIISAACLLYICELWVNRLEPVFGKITAWAEEKMKRAETGLPLTLAKPGSRINGGD